MRRDVLGPLEIQSISSGQLRQVLRAERHASGGRVPHRVRPTVEGSGGVHVTWKLVDGIPSLRQKRMLQELVRCFRAAKERFGLDLIGYTVMGNHLHLIVGAKSDDSLRRGLQGLGVRLARAVNRTLGRSGKVFRERFFARVLRTQRAVYYTVRYALQNARKHGVSIPTGEWDRYSSACYRPGTSRPPARDWPVVLPDPVLWPWLASALSLLHPSDVPGPGVYA
jgi:REP element-mobilizing transposase RayT